jgi:hypothetical protein
MLKKKWKFSWGWPALFSRAEEFKNVDNTFCSLNWRMLKTHGVCVDKVQKTK